MLSGIIAVRAHRNLLPIFVAAIILFSLLILTTPPLKLNVNPSFMTLAILVCVAIYRVILSARCELLEYLGRHPLSSWVILFVFFVIPLITRFLRPYDLKMHWVVGNLLSLICIPVLYLISKCIERIILGTRRIVHRTLEGKQDVVIPLRKT
jgi:hypothetical protein